MIFGPVPVEQAAGAILAHSVAVPGGRLRKGMVIDAAALARLKAASIQEVVVARLGPGDLDENTAASRLGAALGAHLRQGVAATGRVNLHARHAGVMEFAPDAVHAFNAVNPMITLATLAPMARVVSGQIVATVKIISYAVPEKDVDRACAAARPLRVRPVMRPLVTLIETRLGETPPSAKGRRAVQGRLSRLGAQLGPRQIVPHDPAAIGEALRDDTSDMVLLLTGSATSDPRDVGPLGLTEAGGTLIRFGMPVDPGNLLFLGAIGGKPVLGLPGCARSPALNGADWVLDRLLCGIDVSGSDISAMGVGGLLKDIPSRPLPRRAIEDG